MIETKAVLVTNVTKIQERDLTVTLKVEEGKVDLVRLSFNGKGEIFSLPVEQLQQLIDVLQETLDDFENYTHPLRMEQNMRKLFNEGGHHD